MAADDLLLERDGRVALLTFNRPEARNAMTFEMYERLHDLCGELDRDADVRVVVLRGAGAKAFVSGTDIRQFLDFKTREDALGYEARISRVLLRVAGMSKPTIAMVQGDAVGGGLFMSLACDLRLAATGGGQCRVSFAVRARSWCLLARRVPQEPGHVPRDRLGSEDSRLVDCSPAGLWVRAKVTQVPRRPVTIPGSRLRPRPRSFNIALVPRVLGGPTPAP